MNSCKNIPMPADPLSRPIVLRIEGLGHVPSFKNGKQISIHRRSEKRFVRTDPRKKEWMQKAIQSIESQLRGMLATAGCGTLGACLKQSRIASWMPLDDSIHWMIPDRQEVEFVERGKEGATITITKVKQ